MQIEGEHADAFFPGVDEWRGESFENELSVWVDAKAPEEFVDYWINIDKTDLPCHENAKFTISLSGDVAPFYVMRSSKKKAGFMSAGEIRLYLKEQNELRRFS